MSAKRGSRWQARWREYPGGPQQYETFATKRQADLHEAAMRVDLAKGAYIDPRAAGVGFASFAAAWLERQVTWRPATRAGATNAVEHACARWGDRPLGTITRSEVVSLFQVLEAANMAPSTMRTIRKHLSALFASAVLDGLIARNPATRVRLPEVHRSMVVPSAGEVAALHAAAPAGFAVAVVLGAGLGLRQSEARGLSLDRVDFLRREITIDRQLARYGGLAWVAPKTKRSRRVIPAPPEVLDALALHLEQHGSGPGGLLLHRGDRCVTSETFGRLWRATAKAAGVPCRFHDLRHHVASEVLATGGADSLLLAANLLGDSPSTVLATYAHLVQGDDDRTRAALGAVWSRVASSGS